MLTNPPVPAGYQNWIAYERGEPALRAFEFALYTDAVLNDEIRTGVGPYQVLNTIAGIRPAQPGRRVLGLVLHAPIHLPETSHLLPPPETTKAHPGSYHAGWLDDEVAALISLATDIRCASGGLVRWYEPADAPRGRPQEFDHAPPYLPPPPHDRNTVLPRVAREVAISTALPLLGAYSQVAAGSVVALVRAARLYQQALWNAEADPSLAWIQLVSAIEVAARSWAGVTNLPPPERLRLADPALAALLDTAPVEVRDAVAKELAPLLRSQARFLQFLAQFAPPAPEGRPIDAFRLDWNDLERALRVIYSHRSKALHEGLPFPTLMCSAPVLDDNRVPWEIPAGLGSGTGDAYWPAETTPMHVHTFAYITGASLRSWWEELERPTPDEAAPK